MNALELLPGVPINTWSVVLNGAEAYRYQTGTVAFPRVLPQLRATMLLQWVLERLPQVNVLLCSESRLFFLSPQDLADPDFLATHQPCTFTGLEAALCYPWLKLLFAAPRPILERLEGWAVDHSILEVMDRVYTSPTYLEFLPRGVHKGRCLRDLRCLDVLRGRRDQACRSATIPTTWSYWPRPTSPWPWPTPCRRSGPPQIITPSARMKAPLRT